MHFIQRQRITEVHLSQVLSYGIDQYIICEHRNKAGEENCRPTSSGCWCFNPSVNCLKCGGQGSLLRNEDDKTKRELLAWLKLILKRRVSEECKWMPFVVRSRTLIIYIQGCTHTCTLVLDASLCFQLTLKASVCWCSLLGPIFFHLLKNVQAFCKVFFTIHAEEMAHTHVNLCVYKSCWKRLPLAPPAGLTANHFYYNKGSRWFSIPIYVWYC